MSNLSQFYPQGSGASGFIDVETLILSGGGGGGGGGGVPQIGAAGGGGAVFYGFLSIEPGSACPVVIGAGGAGTAIILGNNGSDSSVTTPTGTYRVAGGGGAGLRGGTGGGDPYQLAVPLTSKNNGHYGIGGVESYAQLTNISEFGPGFYFANWSGSESGVSVRNGTYMGFSGGGRAALPTSGSVNAVYYSVTASGGAGGPVTRVLDLPNSIYGLSGPGYISNITGSTVEYGSGNGSYTGVTTGPANSGTGGGGSTVPTPSGYAGGSGVVVMRYPTQFAEASFTPTPAVTDLSPATPGYRTYRVTASATITFPQ